MSLADFKIVKFLGKGSFGSVHRVIRKSDGKEYALKEVKIKYMQQQEREEAVNEVRILASIRHPCIIHYCESFCEADKLYIVTDFAEGGDLSTEIKKHKLASQSMDEETIWSFFIQICIGLAALHKQKVLHRDLKCQNIFLTKDKLIRIGDLGVAKLLKQGVTKTQVGTPYYISPEIWKRQPYDSKSDVWSLGCVLYELATFRHPFTATSPKELAHKIMTGRYTLIPPSYSKDLAEMIRRLLVVDAAKRPSVEEILQMQSVQKRMQLIPKVVQDYVHAAQEGRAPGVHRVINTIKVPRNLGRLSENLPSPCYPGMTHKKSFVRSPVQEARKPVLNALAARISAVPAQRPHILESKPIVKPDPSGAENGLHPRVRRPVAKNLIVEKKILRDKPISDILVENKNRNKGLRMIQPVDIFAKAPAPKPGVGVSRVNLVRDIGKENYIPLKKEINVEEEIRKIREKRKALEELNRRLHQQIPVAPARAAVRRY